MMTKSSIPFCRSRCADAMPPGPPPMMATSWSGSVMSTPFLRRVGPGQSSDDVFEHEPPHGTWAVQVHAHGWEQFEAQQHADDPLAGASGVDVGTDLPAALGLLHQRFPQLDRPPHEVVADVAKQQDKDALV